MSDEDYSEEQEDFIARFNAYLEEADAEQKAREQEIIQDVSKDVMSIMNDGSVYVHAGHIDEVIVEAVKSMNQTVEAFGESGDIPPQVIGYTVGVTEVVRVLHFIMRGLVMKHSEDIELPMDDLLGDINDVLKRGDK